MTRTGKLGIERGWRSFETAAPRFAVLSISETWSGPGDGLHVRRASASSGGAPIAYAERPAWAGVFVGLTALAREDGDRGTSHVKPEPDLDDLDAAWEHLVAVVAQMTDARYAMVEAMIAADGPARPGGHPAGGIGVELAFDEGEDEWRAVVSIGRYWMGEGDACPVTALVEAMFDLLGGGLEVLVWGGG